MLKPAVHKKDWQHTDDIGLFIKKLKENSKYLNDEMKRCYELIKRLEDEDKEFFILIIECSIKRTLTPKEKIKLKELM